MDESLDEDDVRHIVERQVKPQLRAKELGIETRMVSVDPDAVGETITCGGCGRTATVPPAVAAQFKAPGKAALCPECIGTTT